MKIILRASRAIVAAAVSIHAFALRFSARLKEREVSIARTIERDAAVALRVAQNVVAEARADPAMLAEAKEHAMAVEAELKFWNRA